MSKNKPSIQGLSNDITVLYMHFPFPMYAYVTYIHRYLHACMHNTCCVDILYNSTRIQRVVGYFFLKVEEPRKSLTTGYSRGRATTQRKPKLTSGVSSFPIVEK
ncbi:unnamed protein product [Cuscuta epithymum]|uniref:Uncharacterized protein n=1 Tax=Cuscuta epithymum TaxID=186058 RepID=A0AAV0DHI3_9ASTE|nr:unnamed protein product [Cuscuta epithymum]